MSTPSFWRSDGWVKSAQGAAVPGAQIYVCNQPANVDVVPPSPLASIFSDSGGLVPITQPLITDGFGHYDFYAAPGIYTVIVALGGVVQQVYPDQSVGLANSTVGSVFGRTGSIVAQSGDYNISQITGAAAVVFTDRFWGGRGTSDPTNLGTPTTLLPVTGLVTDQKVGVIRFTLDASIVISQVILGATNFTGGVAGGVGIYDVATKNLIFQVGLSSPGTSAPFSTPVNPPQTLVAGDYYFAWTAATTLFAVRSIAMDEVINALLNQDASDIRVAYSSFLGVNGVLPNNLGTLTALDLNVSTAAASYPMVLFSV